MGIRAWIHRTKDDGARPPRSRAKHKPPAAPRGKAAKAPPARPSREEPYNSEFITRFGDPFD